MKGFEETKKEKIGSLIDEVVDGEVRLIRDSSKREGRRMKKAHTMEG